MNTPAGGATLPELLPCPCCKIRPSLDLALSAVGPRDTDAEVIAAWNNRATLTALARVVYNTDAALAGEWRDIASAPRDCTAIIATDGKEVRMSFTANGVFFSGFQSNPTHWMPLPAAPLPKEHGR